MSPLEPPDPKGSCPKMEPPEPELPEPVLPEPVLPEPVLPEPELPEPELLDPVLPEEFPGLAPWALLLTKVRDGHRGVADAQPDQTGDPDEGGRRRYGQGRAAASRQARLRGRGGRGAGWHPPLRRARRTQAGRWARGPAGAPPGRSGPTPMSPGVATSGHGHPDQLSRRAPRHRFLRAVPIPPAVPRNRS